MEGDIKDVLAKSASVRITYDSTKTNKIEFHLPNNEMPHNVIKIIRALKQYKKLENMCFNRIDTSERRMERWDKKIIFKLNGKYMQNLNSEWECAIASDLEKNHLFHPFELVIINRKNKNTNVSQNNENIKAADINTTIDKWDMECKEIQNEWQKRELEKCNLFDESFGILSDIEKTRLKLDKIGISSSASENTLIQIERNNASNGILTQDILIIQNFIRLAEERVLKQELERKERNMINEGIHDKFETHIRKMNSFLLEIKKEIDENNIMQKNSATLKMVGGHDDLKNENINYEYKMKENMCKYNKFMYDICLNNIQNIDIGKNSDIIDNLGGNESSLNLQKLQLKKENDNKSNSMMSVQGYVKIHSFDSSIHKVDDTQNILYAFSLVIMASIDNYTLIISVIIDVQGLYDECIIYDDCG